LIVEVAVEPDAGFAALDDLFVVAPELVVFETTIR
jgi:hypothetical protein